MSLTSRKAKLFGLAAVAASLAISIGLGEVILRLIASDRYYVWPPGWSYVFRPTPEIMPGVEAESRFSINDGGLRAGPFSDRDTHRILEIGGSTTECLYLDDREAWPYLLQELLSARQGFGGRVWVGNAGKSGHNTRNHVVQVGRLLDQYPNIHVVLVLVGANDFMLRLRLDENYRPFPGVERLTPNEYDTLMDRSFSVRPGTDSRYPYLKRTEIWRSLRMIKNRYFDAPAPLSVQDETGEIYRIWRRHRQMATSLRGKLPDLSSALDEYSSNVTAIVEHARSRGVAAVLVTQPFIWRADLTVEERSLLWMGGVGDYQREPGHEYYSVEALAAGMQRYNETLVEICRATDVQCIDLASGLPKDTSVFYDDMHFNESGARAVAAVLARHYSPRMQSVSR